MRAMHPVFSRHYHTLFLPISPTYVISSTDMHQARILVIGTNDAARAWHREEEEDDSDDEGEVGVTGVTVTRDQGPEAFAGRRRCHELATNFTKPFAFPRPAFLSAAACICQMYHSSGACTLHSTCYQRADHDFHLRRRGSRVRPSP